MKSKKLLISFLSLLVLVPGIFPLPVFGQQVKINSGAYLKNTGTAYLVINNADLINNGAYVKSTETVIFSGTAAKVISGSSNIDMYNLLVTNTAGITTQLGLLTTNNLTVASGSRFTIDPAKTVTVNGTLTNSAGNAGFVLKSDLTGTASLLHNTTTVTATVQRYISGPAEAWHLLSSPVAGQSISGNWLPSGTYGNLTGYDLYLWNEPNSCWIYKLDLTSAINWNTVHSGTNFEVGRGYLYSLQALNPTKEFAGNLNTGSLSYGLTINGTNLGFKGFILAGNPYPSSIDWQASAGWTRSNLVSSGGGYDMWIWNPAGSNYGVCNSFTGFVTNGVTRYVPPMQGFFVQAVSAGSLDMDNSARVHNGAGNWLKKGLLNELNIVSISVNSESGNGFDEVGLLFGSKPDEYGTMKLFSPVLTAPSLFLPVKGENFSVRYLTDTIDYPFVPLMFKPGSDGRYTISCSFDMISFETVMLEDRQLHFIQNLKTKNTYTFTSSETDNASRFVLHFAASGLIEKNDYPARIYTDGASLVIDLTLVNKETDVSVYDMMGRKLLKIKLEGQSLHKFDINAHTELLMVFLTNMDGSVCQKVMWVER
jgi:hypothetical protein